MKRHYINIDVSNNVNMYRRNRRFIFIDSKKADEAYDKIEKILKEMEEEK